jgi:hypothetical protein
LTGWHINIILAIIKIGYQASTCGHHSPSRTNVLLGMVPLSAKSGRVARHRPFSRCSLSRHTTQNRAFPRFRNGPPLLISCKNNKNSGEPSRERTGLACLTVVGLDSNINLKEKSCCRVAADAASGDGQLNRSLRRRQLRAPARWRSIEVAVMLIRYRGRGRSAA